MEEISVLGDAERAALLLALKKADRQIKFGNYAEYEGKDLQCPP